MGKRHMLIEQHMEAGFCVVIEIGWERKL